MSSEVLRLQAENSALRRQREELEQHQGEGAQRKDLDAIATRILKSLKLGTQAPGYKVARKALDQFIGELTNE